MGDFLSQSEFGERRNITDIFISIKDIAIIVEVKRHGGDCESAAFTTKPCHLSKGLRKMALKCGPCVAPGRTWFFSWKESNTFSNCSRKIRTSSETFLDLERDTLPRMV